jgi:hypothetical protein
MRRTGYTCPSPGSAVWSPPWSGRSAGSCSTGPVAGSPSPTGPAIPHTAHLRIRAEASRPRRSPDRSMGNHRSTADRAGPAPRRVDVVVNWLAVDEPDLTAGLLPALRAPGCRPPRHCEPPDATSLHLGRPRYQEIHSGRAICGSSLGICQLGRHPADRLGGEPGAGQPAAGLRSTLPDTLRAVRVHGTGSFGGSLSSQWMVRDFPRTNTCRRRCAWRATPATLHAAGPTTT